jgi:hypothetical protein
MPIGKIQRVPLREVWKHEALDFTRWLENNIDVLGEVIDLPLSNAERERHAGDFNVDLVAQDESGNLVVIENQLEKSNHDHLGKVVTYLAAMGAKTALWIVSEPRPEHVQAITWLNESSAASFYLLKVEGIKIENSSPAPLLTLIVGPSEEGKQVGKTKKEFAERDHLRHDFFAELLSRAREKTKLHSAVSAGWNHWVGAGAGKAGLTFNYLILKNEGAVELYIDRGKDSDAENKKLFDTLLSDKKAIELDFGDTLDWQRLDNKRACRIKKVVVNTGFRDRDKWTEIQDKMIETMVRFEKAVKPRIEKIKV